MNLYNNKLLIEKVEKAALCVDGGHHLAGEEAFEIAMKEADAQLTNPRRDSAEVINR